MRAILAEEGGGVRFLLIFVSVSAVWAQEGPPVRILRGVLLEWNSGPAGEYSVRDPQHRVHRCTFDDQTYFERNGDRIPPAEVHAGSRVEAVTSERGEPGRCRTLLFNLLASAPEAYGKTPPAWSLPRRVLDATAPRGDLTLSAIVLRLDGDLLQVRTRQQGQKTLRLRRDTRYAWDGREADASMLEPNVMVFVRAGRGIAGEVEAYQIIRGKILLPGLPSASR